MNDTVKKSLAILATFIAIIMGVLAFDDRMDNKVCGLETKLVGTLEQFKSTTYKESLQQRYIMLTDQLMQLKLMIYKYPKDASLKEDWDRTWKERESVRQQLDNKR